MGGAALLRDGHDRQRDQARFLGIRHVGHIGHASVDLAGLHIAVDLRVGADVDELHACRIHALGTQQCNRRYVQQAQVGADPNRAPRQVRDPLDVRARRIDRQSRGLLRGEALGKYVNSQLNGLKIEDMKLPLGIVATDLHTGLGVLFQKGDIATAVRASSAVPAMFDPVRIGGRDFVDGGLVSPVPVRYARQMGADVVLAVDISSTPESNKASGMLQVLLQTFTIMGKSIKEYELREAEVVVRPALDGVGSASFGERQRAIQAGRQAMQQALPELKRFLQP